MTYDFLSGDASGLINAIVDLAATGTEAGLQIASTYRSLEAQKANATTQEELLKLQLKQRKLERDALKILHEKMGIKEEKSKKIAKTATIGGLVGLSTLLLFAQ